MDCYELPPVTNCRLLQIVAYHELSAVTNCRLIGIVAQPTKWAEIRNDWVELKSSII